MPLGRNLLVSLSVCSQWFLTYSIRLFLYLWSTGGRCCCHCEIPNVLKVPSIAETKFVSSFPGLHESPTISIKIED